MKLVTFFYNQQVRTGVLVHTHAEPYILDLSAACPELPRDLSGLLKAGEPALAQVRQALEAHPTHEGLIPLSAVTLRAPIPNPGKIICLGHNYFDHMGNDRNTPAEYPTLFCKTINTITGPNDPVLIPAVTKQVDYEAELAVIIGKTAHNVAEEHAMDYVAGYSVFNDFSARDYQKRTSQWMIGKSFDTFGPLGPALVTRDEISDPHDLELSLSVNGVETQLTNTRNMIFCIPFLISYISQVMTLDPGDIISTGTPARLESARSLPQFLSAGDVVVTRIEKIGELHNTLKNA